MNCKHRVQQRPAELMGASVMAIAFWARRAIQDRRDGIVRSDSRRPQSSMVSSTIPTSTVSSSIPRYARSCAFNR